MMKKRLIDKWLNNEATPADFEDLRTMPEFSSYLKIDEYVKKLDLPALDLDEGLSAVKRNINQVKKPIRILQLHNLLKIAAVLVLLIASYFYINSLPTNIDTKIAETNIVELPDTSEVILNENSHLSFSKSEWNEKREVSLDGEAYFEVAKGKTFDVITKHGVVSVLGTKFNVLSREGSFEIKCFEGLVSVTYQGKSVNLAKGKTLSVKNETLRLDKVFVNKPTWVYNESSYDNVGILDVLKEVESRYSVIVSTENINVNLRFTGTFSHDNLEAALQTITIPLELTYRIENNNEVTISPKTSSE